MDHALVVSQLCQFRKLRDQAAVILDYDQSADRLEAMKTLKISRELSDFQFILVLVDYNPNSVQLDLSQLENLPFAKQVKIFHGGLAMWQQNVKPIASASR
jgi:hypothetical protein